MKGKTHQHEPICSRCARCCEYFCIEVDEARSKADYDDYAWILAHQDVAIHIEKKQWQLMVHNRCRYLSTKSGCLIYANRPRICREHVPGDCERDHKHRHDYQEMDRIITTVEELEAYRQEQLRERRRLAAKRRRRAPKSRRRSTGRRA